MNWSNFIVIMFLCVVVVVEVFWIRSLSKTIQEMHKTRTRFYNSMTDPNKIAADMERGAVAMEALVARRHRNVRDDAGPHARIYKPKRLRGRLPKS